MSIYVLLLHSKMPVRGFSAVLKVWKIKISSDKRLSKHITMVSSCFFLHHKEISALKKHSSVFVSFIVRVSRIFIARHSHSTCTFIWMSINFGITTLQGCRCNRVRDRLILIGPGWWCRLTQVLTSLGIGTRHFPSTTSPFGSKSERSKIHNTKNIHCT